VELADNKVKIASVFFGERAFERYIYRQFKGTFKLPISPPLNIHTVDYRITVKPRSRFPSAVVKSLGISANRPKNMKERAVPDARRTGNGSLNFSRESLFAQAPGGFLLQSTSSRDKTQ
jgi:hypothetical protein